MTIKIMLPIIENDLGGSKNESSRFQQIPYHQNHVTAEGKRHPENKNSFYKILQTALSPTYNPTKPNYQGNYHK